MTQPIKFMSNVKVQLPAEGLSYYEVMEGIQVQLLRDALERAGGVKSKAARLLQIQRPTLLAMLRKYGFPLEQPIRKIKQPSL